MAIHAKDRTTRRTTITPKLAANLLKLNYGKQRSLKTWKLASYAKAIKDGRMHLEPIRIAYVKALRQDKLYDGQHRLKAAYDAGLEFEAIVVRDVVDTEIDLLELNRWVDQGTKRSPNDNTRYWVEAKILAGEFNGHEYSRTIISAIRAALAWRTWVSPRAHSQNEAVDLLDEYADLRDSVLELMESMNNPPHLARVAVIAAMMDTLEVSPKAAKVYWYKVGTLDNLPKNSIEAKLGKYLIGKRILDRGTNKTPDFYKKCIGDWNRAHPEAKIKIKAVSKMRCVKETPKGK